MKIYGLKTCDSCRKAMKQLEAAGKAFEYLDVRVDGVPEDVLNRAYQEFGLALVNKSSATWRGFSDEQKNADMKKALTDHPTLMKRPLIVDGNQMTLGWKAVAQSTWIS